MMMWLNYLNRRFVLSGKLKSLIEESKLEGVIFRVDELEKAIAETRDYDKLVSGLIRSGKSVHEIIMAVVISDVRRAANQFILMQSRSKGKSGHVVFGIRSEFAWFELSIVDEVRHLWKEIDRKNVIIDMPGSKESTRAIPILIADAINLKVSNPIGFKRFHEILLGYLEGLEKRKAERKSLDQIHFLVSFNLKLIDELIDPLLLSIIQQSNNQSVIAIQMLGKSGIMFAAKIRQIYDEVFKSERFAILAADGARPANLMWDFSKKTENDQNDGLLALMHQKETSVIFSMDNLGAATQNPAGNTLAEASSSTIKWNLFQLENILGVNFNHLEEQMDEITLRDFNLPSKQLYELIRERIISTATLHWW